MVTLVEAAPASSIRRPAADSILLSIQAGRGVAALLVVLHHGERALALPQYVGYAPLGGMTTFGHAGVNFFFVLSGFIIYYIHAGDLGRPDKLRRYAVRRAVRIYPVYWLVTLLLLLVGVAAHGVASLPTAHDLSRTLLLTPGAGQLTLGVAWTLVCEVRFYILFGLAIIDWRLALVAILASVTAGFAPWPDWASSIHFWGFGWHDALFPLGIAAAWVTPHYHMLQPRVFAALGAVIFLLAGLCENAGLMPIYSFESRLAYGLASAALIVGMVQAERAGDLRIGGALTLLGAASYSIYLVHMPVLGYAARALAMTGLVTRVPGWCVMVVVVAFTVAAGIGFHLWIERPLARVMQRLIATRPKQSRI